MAREMKDSGIEWIGKIPIGWSISKTVNRFDLIGSGTTPRTYADDFYVDGEINWIQSGDLHDKYLTSTSKRITQMAFEQTSTLKMYFPEYLVMAMYGASVGNLSIATIKACTNQACCVLAGEKDNLRFMYYVLTAAKEFLVYSAVGGTQPNVSQNVIKELRIPIPLIGEQQRIAGFLDKKTAKLDNVLEKTRASIEEYKKLKQAVITQAVTKGIRGDREMKDSGIKWIGEIPVEWEVSQVKYSLKWKSEKGQPEEKVLSLYRDYGIIPKDSRDDNHNVTSLDTSGYKVVDIGDFVINKMKAWQGSMSVSEYRGIISPAYHVCEFTNNKLNRKYFHYLMRNKSYIPEYTRLSTGMRVGQWDLGFNDFKNIPFLLPPQEEQEEIANYLDKKCSAIGELIAKKEQYLAEIENYKKSLIYEYVTGKKEVPQGYWM